jgi:hypothetical protein
MTRLLLVSCSATKRAGLSLPALERYDGPKYRVLRRALADGIEPLTVRILSAAYGLIGPEHEIANYNLELMPKSAGVLARCPWRRGDIVGQVERADDVFVMAGGLYLDVLRQWCPASASSWRTATGAPGQRLQQLGQWLRNTNQGSATA